MKKIAIILSIGFISTGHAFAQQPPPFEPYTITAQEHQAFLTYLGDVPAKYANPLINQLGQMEQQAVQKKVMDAAKIKAETPKKPDVNPSPPSPPAASPERPPLSRRHPE